MILSSTGFLIVFLSEGSPEGGPESVAKTVRWGNVTVLGTDSGPPELKIITKNLVKLKIMKNLDFGLLEILYY